MLCSGLSPAQESHAVWKNAGEKPARGFFFWGIIRFYFDSGCGRATPARSPTRWKYPIIEFQNRFKVVRQEWRIQIGNMRRLCGSNSGRSVGGCGYMRTPHPALPFSNLPLPFFCIILTPPHSLSTVFSPKTGALSHRAVRGINIPDSNCIGEDRSTALRLSCPNDMPRSRPNGSSRGGSMLFF